MTLPEIPKKLLTIFYQNYLQFGHTQYKIPYDSIDCSKPELSDSLVTLKLNGYIDSYSKRKGGVFYSLTAKGIAFCSDLAASKVPLTLSDTSLTNLQKDLLKDLLSDINNQELSEKNKKAAIKDKLSDLMGSMSAETFTDILSDLLCH